jgi:hypothetical protein
MKFFEEYIDYEQIGRRIIQIYSVVGRRWVWKRGKHSRKLMEPQVWPRTALLKTQVSPAMTFRALNL